MQCKFHLNSKMQLLSMDQSNKSRLSVLYILWPVRICIKQKCFSHLGQTIIEQPKSGRETALIFTVLSVGTVFLHFVAHCTCNFSVFYFSLQSISKIISEKTKFLASTHKKYYTENVRRVVNWKLHCATSSKITAPTDKICENESKNHTTSKKSPFSAHFFTPGPTAQNDSDTFMYKFSGLVTH